MKMKLLAAATLISAQLAGCSSGDRSNTTNPLTEPETGTTDVIDLDNVRKVLETNADIALAGYSDSVDTAKALQTALTTFKNEPTQANLDAAKLAWLVAREPYGQTEVYRFRLSPIDSTNYADEDGPEGDINAWPLGEALIDYVQTGTDFGDDQVGVTSHETGVADPIPTNNIINSTAIEINEALISKTATADDEHDVIAGYHAIEFMLWGQDLNETGSGLSADTVTNRELSTGGDILTSGGHRPLEDFTSNDHADRRHQYLEVVAAKLVADLESVRDSWEEGASYRTSFTTVANETQAKQKLSEILTGMGTLSEGELAGERMQIAFASNSQEDEHSCFSDNTHRDIWLNAEGVSNSYYGDYAGYDSNLDGTDDAGTTVTGYGLDDYLADAGLTTLATDIKARLDATEANYMAIDTLARNGTPVDVQILEATADEPMAKTIQSLNAQASGIATLAETLTIDGDVVDDDGTACDTSDPTTECPA